MGKAVILVAFDISISGGLFPSFELIFPIRFMLDNEFLIKWIALTIDFRIGDLEKRFALV